MAVTVGSSDAILSGAVGGSGTATPLPTFVEVLTRGNWDGLELELFPPDSQDAPPEELLGDEVPMHPNYPIVPQRSSNRLNFRTDNKTWKVVQKSKNKWGHEFITIQFTIIKAAYMKTFYQFLEDNAGKVVSFSTPGFQPFLRTTETNPVYIKNFSKPQRVKPKTYTISVTLLCDPNQK